jgi:thiol:disulfide interchange protein/DsbC/DsbD-like thiol-disulfide interchange protein
MSRVSSWVLVLASLSLLEAEPAKIPHGTVELISAVNSIQPGSDFQVGLHFQLEPGWHIYWKNPGDSGQPPRLKWDLPEGLTAGEIEWPVPKRVPVGPLLDYGYDGEVLLPVTLHAAPSFSATSPQKIVTNMRVLVCRETCIPGKASLSLMLPVTKAKAKPIESNAKLFEQANAAQPEAIPASWKLSAKQSASSIQLDIAGAPRTENISFVPAHPNQIENAAPQHVALGPSSVDLKLKRPAESPAQLPKLEGLLLLERDGKPVAYTIATDLEAGAPEAPSSSPLKASSQSLITILLLAFGGGVILNLMPCVFPVLSIKVLGLLDSSGGDRKTIRVGAALYTLGVLVSFWVLVGVLLALRAGGRSLGWGFQLQSPGFVAFLICLLFVLGLSLMGAFEIGTSLMNTGSGLTHGGKYSNSFFTGVLATVVATPCTAPLMGVAVGFALTQSVLTCVSVFTVMAIGLAAPFLALAFFPQLSRLLPKCGPWMETLKQAMAFLVFGSVVWLLWVLGQQVGMNQLAGMLFTLLILSIAAWVIGRWPQRRTIRIPAIIIGLGVAAYCCALLKPAAAGTLAETASAGNLKWEPFTPERLATYRSSGKPVLIDFTAAWCLTCQVNDRLVFHSREVEDRLNRSDIALLRADWTSYDPTITEWLAKFGRSGIPFYVIYGPEREAAPTTLPDGLISPSTLLQRLDKLKI